MKIKVFGPSLSAAAQKKGAIHVHAADCADTKHYGPGRKYGGEWAENEPTIEMASAKDVVHFVYPPDEFDYDGDTEWTDYESDLYIAPCVNFKAVTA